jgi:hypothetical protein
LFIGNKHNLFSDKAFDKIDNPKRLASILS